jgi:hypothetical protein
MTPLSGAKMVKTLTLVVRDLMARLVDARKAEVAILADLTVFRTVYNHGLIACGTELVTVSVIQCQTDGFTTKPVA